MKKLFYVFLTLLVSLTVLTACNNEEAAVKVKFCDSLNSEKTYFQGTYDLNSLKETGLSEFVPTKEGYKFIGWTLDVNGTEAFSPTNYAGTVASLQVYAQWEELRKIVTYSGASALKTYYYDDLVSGKVALDDASKNGYVFKGWSVDSSNEVEFKLSTFTYPDEIKSVKIFANFEIITTLSFYNQNELSYQFNLADVKAGTVNVPTPSKEGYTFAGWFLDKDYTEKFDAASYVGVSANVALYAKFDQKPMVYYYDEQKVVAKFYLENKDSETVSNPTKEGYDFIGWVDENGNEFTIKDNATSNQNAYAKWEQKVTVNFFDGTEVIKSMYLDALTASNIPTATKDTYIFLGWFTDQALENAFDLSTYATQSKVVVLYAKFIRNTTIVFMNGTQEVGERYLSQLKDGSKTAPQATKDGFIFNKWTLDEAGEKAFSALQYTTEELTVNVYAQWTEKAKVNYHVDNNVYESKVLDSITNEYVPENPTKEGYTFIKWVNENNEDFVLDSTSTKSLNAYAVFEQRVSAKFYVGSELVATKYYDELKSESDLPSISKATYTFKGWFLDQDLTMTYSLTFVPQSKEVKIYAKLEKNTSVIFMNGDTQVGTVLLSSLKEKTASLPTVTKDGFMFDKWTLDSAGNTAFVYQSYTTENETVIVYAQWTETAKVNYYVDSTVYESKSLSQINNEYVPEAPTKVGYTFIKWVNENKEDFVLDCTSQTSVNAYAVFEQKVTVNFYNGETLITSNYLEDLTENTIPTASKDTYTFEGWYLENTFVNKFVLASYQAQTKEVNLYAKFDKITTVIFMNGDKEYSRTLLSALKSGTQTIANPEKAGYNFVEWQLANGNKFVADKYTTEEAEVTVAAIFQAKVKVVYYTDSENVFLTKTLDEITNEFVPETTPTKDGYFFLKWVTEDGADFAVDTESTTDLAAYPKWVKNPSIEDLQVNISGTTVKVTWTSVKDTTYKVSLDGSEYVSVEGASYTLPSTAEIGKHQVSVIGTIYNHDSQAATIDVTQKVNFTLTNVKFDKNTRTITWDAVSNAQYYQVKFNDAAEWTKVYTNEYVVSKDVAADNYNLTVEVYVSVGEIIVPSFAPATTSIEIVSVERITESGLYINEKDEYVLLAGVNYSFGDYAFKDATWYTLSNSNKTITPKVDAIGGSYELVTTTDKKIKAYVAGYVSSISGGSNWNYYRSSSSVNNLNNEETNKTGFMVANNMYEVGTGDEDFILDLDVEGSGTKVTDFLFDISGKVGDDAEISKYLCLVAKSDNKYHLSFTTYGKDLIDGTIIELTIKPHYLTSQQMSGSTPSYTFKFKANSGVNAYGFEDLKTKFADTNNKTVNLHQNVFINHSMLKSNFAQSEETNNWDESLIKRYAVAEEHFRFNGNYFKVDASALNRGKYKENPAGPGYTVCWVQVGVFMISSSSINSTLTVGDTTYDTIKKAKVDFENVEIKGNATLTTSIEAASDSVKLAKELLDQSGAIDGILTQDCTDTFKNCVIHHVNEAIKYCNTNLGTEENPSYIENNKHVIESCAMGDNWANSSYIWGDGYYIYKNCHIYNSSGVAIILGDCHTCTLGKSKAVEYRDDENDILLTNFPTVIFDNTEVDNWMLGSEAYFTAYGLGTQIPGYKVQMENMIEGFTSGKYTLLRKDSNGYSYVNMVLQALCDNEKCLSYDIGYVKADGSIAVQQVRTKYVTSSNPIPDHFLAADDPNTVLFPIGDISQNAACTQAIADISQELYNFGGYLQSQISYDQFKALSPYISYVYTDEEIAATLPGVVTGDAATQTAFVTSTLYKYAFMKAEETQTDSGFFVEMSRPSLLGKNSLTTIIIQGEKVTK